MRRRRLIAGASALVGAATATLVTAAAAEPAPIAVVSTGNAATAAPFLAAFRRGLAQAGLVEGRDFALATHFVDGDVNRLAALAEAVVASRPRVIVASSPAAAIALRRATAVVPIVAATAVDPVAAGLAASLARPGGNVTGLSGQELDVLEKQAGLIPDLLPRARRVLGLSSETLRLALGDPLGRAFTTAAARLGLASRLVHVGLDPDLPLLRTAIVEFRPDVIFVITTPVTAFLRHEIVAVADAERLPVVAPYRMLTEAGALASYGPDLTRNWSRAAWYVDRILKGANPAEMPFEQPTGFEPVINLRTARALGLTVPPLLLTLADEVIE